MGKRRMRMIKFRAWLKDENRYIIVGCIDWAKECVQEINGISWYGFDSIILEQFTGAYDKNGKEIYIGDIIELIDRYIYVEWNEFLYMHDVRFLRYKEDRDRNYVFGGVKFKELREYEVIGNIHEL